jgi:hypothetical protein
MPGIEELLGMAGQGGGGPPMPSGGGGPPGGQGQAMVQTLQRLMQDPVAMKGMQQYAQQMGMQMPGGGGAPPPGPMDMPPEMASGPPPGQGPAGRIPMDMPPPGREQEMVSQQMDEAGATWDGTDAPTQNDIERLQAEPSQTNIDSFNEHFGEGMAEKYLDEGSDEEGPTAPEDTAPEDA